MCPLDRAMSVAGSCWRRREQNNESNQNNENSGYSPRLLKKTDSLVNKSGRFDFFPLTSTPRARQGASPPLLCRFDAPADGQSRSGLRRRAEELRSEGTPGVVGHLHPADLRVGNGNRAQVSNRMRLAPRRCHAVAQVTHHLRHPLAPSLRRPVRTSPAGRPPR